MIQAALLHAPESHAPEVPVSDWTPPGCLRIGKRTRHRGPVELRLGAPTRIGRPRRIAEPVAQMQCLACSKGLGTRVAVARLHPTLIGALRYWSGEQLELGALRGVNCMDSNVAEGRHGAGKVG